MDSEFFALVLMFQQSVMLHLGKIANPVTGKSERNLVQSQMAVDILEMLTKKTKGNLDKEEEKFLSNVLADAQLNYASEASKTDEVPKTASPDAAAGAPPHSAAPKPADADAAQDKKESGKSAEKDAAQDVASKKDNK